MNFASLLERYGEATVLAAGGLVIGALFGFFAQRSKFCLRAATLEFWHRSHGKKIAVWLLAFSSAVVGVQLLILNGHMDAASTRQISATGSISGALVGGLLFGAGMVLTRGCASRLLVLSANGNLRALLSGLIFAVTAQAALGGALASWRETISSWWTVDGGAARDLLALTHAGPWGGLAFGLLWLAAALYFAVRSGCGVWKWAGGVGAGLAVAAGWGFNYWVSKNSFEVVPVQGLTFSGPSAEWLMRVVASPAPEIGFNFGLVPGVFLGSFLGAWVGQGLCAGRLQGRLQHAALYCRGHSDGLWRHAGRRLRRGRRHYRWRHFCADRLAGAGRHVGGRGPDRPLCRRPRQSAGQPRASAWTHP